MAAYILCVKKAVETDFGSVSSMPMSQLQGLEKCRGSFVDRMLLLVYKRSR